jgi:hypothetical protein
MKIVINNCYGGFGLSEKALNRYKELSGQQEFSNWNFKRDDPNLVKVVEELGEEASARYAELKIVEIPDDVKDWYIQEYDGTEWVAEGRTWS